MYIREVRWIITCDENGKESKPILEQRNGKYGYWETVPTVKILTTIKIKE